MRTLDIVVIVVYFGGITAAGIYFAKRTRNTEDYFLGGRNFPGWAIGLSMVGTSISSVTFMAFPGDAYRTAWLRLMGALTLPIAVLIATRWFLPFYRRTKTTSAYEYLERRFGPKTRLYAAIVFLLQQILRLGTVLYLVALLLHEITGMDLTLCILVGGVFVSFYTVAGGMEAVVWTDVVQTIVLVFGGFVCLAAIVWALPGGLWQIFEVGFADGKFRIAETSVNSAVAFQGVDTAWDQILSFKQTSWDFTLYRKTGLMMLLVGLNNWIFEYSCNQNVVQRFCAAKSAHEARKAMWICCFASVPIWTFFMFLGTAMYVFFKVFPDPEAFGMLVGAGGQKSESILPYFVLQYLPAGLGGLVVAAVLAAAMSSLDSSINAMATVGIVDIYQRHLVKHADERHYLRAARTLSIVASVLMLAVAYWLTTIDMKTLADFGLIMAALLFGGLLGIYMLGFFTTWGDGRAIFCGIVFTLAFTVWRGGISLAWWDVPSTWWLATDDYSTGIIANTIMFLIGFFVGGLLTIAEGKTRDLTNLTVWTQDGTPIE